MGTKGYLPLLRTSSAKAVGMLPKSKELRAEEVVDGLRLLRLSLASVKSVASNIRLPDTEVSPCSAP